MKRGQHRLLLQETLRTMRALGEHLIERADRADINSSPPGTDGYDNKCQFEDGFYVAVLQELGDRNQRNQIAWGRGADPPTPEGRCGDTVPWSTDDYEVKQYARRTIRWVVNRILAEKAWSPH